VVEKPNMMPNSAVISISPKEKSRQWRGRERQFPNNIVWALFAAVLTASTLAVGCNPIPTPEPTVGPGPSPTIALSDIDHQVQVRDAGTGEAIRNATITLEIVEGVVPVASVTTDQEGQAIISIDPSNTGKVGRLIVRANDYKEDRRLIDLIADPLPHVVFLQKATPTPEPPPPATDTPVVPTALPASPPTSAPTNTSVTPGDTPTPTSSPTFTPSPTSTRIWPTHTPPPSALVIRELWATGTKCLRSGGWSADLWVRPEGGSGTYEYYINGEWKAGPVERGDTISLHSNSCTAIVGTMMVESGGQVKSREFFIDVPDCCD
jgi:hypothetical protein